MKYIWLILIATTLTFPQVHAAYDYGDLKPRFDEHKASFEKLRSMIIADSEAHGGLMIGYHRVGPYLKKDKDKDIWKHMEDPSAQLTTEQVFKKYGITQERYDQYIDLFRDVGHTAVTYFPGKQTGKTRFGEYVSFLGITGTEVEIVKNDDESIPESKLDDTGRGIEIVPLGDGWYIERFSA